MRFERLFADLEAQLDAADVAELTAEVADRTRHQRAQVVLVDRFRASIGAQLRLRLLGAGAVAGTLRAVGTGWLLLREPNGGDVLVQPAVVLEIAGLARVALTPSRGVAERVNFRQILRGLARDRATVAVTTIDGTTIIGTIDGVGADAIDLVLGRVDEPGEWSGSGSGARSAPPRHVLPLSAVALVRER